MKRFVVASLLLSSICTVGCTSKEEKAYYEAQAKLIEESLEIVDTHQEVLEQFAEEYQDEVKDIQSQQVPYLTALTREDLEQIYGKENLIYLD